MSNNLNPILQPISPVVAGTTAPPTQVFNENNYLLPTPTTLNPNLVPPPAYSIMAPSGVYINRQIAMQSGAVPTFMSSAGWAVDSEGLPQQTFLGASIRSFSMQGGFGDNSSSLTVDLVVDEYNKSDNTILGFGDDVYHSGGAQPTNPLVGDNFVPPIPGSPVFFKFGPNLATVSEAFLPVFNDLYFVAPPTVTHPSTTCFETGGTVNLKEFLEGKVELPENTYFCLKNGSSINYSAFRSSSLRGYGHTTFGGILQNYNQSRSPQGNPLYTVNVIDPREILSNVTLILNNYAGPTYEQANILNLYGFLEYNPNQATKDTIKGTMPFESILKKTVNNFGEVLLTGGDKYYKLDPSSLDTARELIKNLEISLATQKRLASEFRRNGNIAGANNTYTQIQGISNNLLIQKRILESQKANTRPLFPMTGTGFSRRGPQGIPYYRVVDSINALMQLYTPLPLEYKNQGFGGRINFRGFNYVVDFSGLPDLPEFYYLDFDEINLLELVMEICDVTNRDFFVTLLPVINHPACKNLYDYNNTATVTVQDMIAGIIRIDTIDRSEQPLYGSIKRYIDNLALQNVYVENQDLGYELSNISTDKFIVGAQEVNTHFFSSNADRDNLAFRQVKKNGVFPNKPPGYEWTLEASLEQQILPYYGKLGQRAVTIPKGFGSYQQILLDSSNLNAAGVGSYYVATEMELRCASISFDRWKDFLRQYNDVYMESLENEAELIFLASRTPSPRGVPLNVDNANANAYGVTVPRSVFDTYATNPYDANGLPSSPCNPPYGYPLYYKRMTQIGIPEAGLTDLFNRWTSLNNNFTSLKFANIGNAGALINSEFQRLKNVKNSQGLSAFEQSYFAILDAAITRGLNNQNIAFTIGLLENTMKNNGKNVFPIVPALAKKNIANALKVYNFVKSVADDCLGKKFLVKIPNKVNVFYENGITQNAENSEYLTGPFGFKPRSIKNIAGYDYSTQFESEMTAARGGPNRGKMMESFLSPATAPEPTGVIGALRINYNPISEKYESNYTPLDVGGYFDFDLYQNTLGATQIGQIPFNSLPSGVKQGLIPQDMSNFINDDGRVFPYVRFDHSEDLSLEGFNDGDFTQQFIVAGYMIPDLIQALDNTGPAEFHTFPNFGNNEAQTKNYSQVSFIKCSVDEQLYMPPKLFVRNIDVHGGQVSDVGQFSLPEKIYVPCSGLGDGGFVPGTGVWVDSIPYYKANYVPLPAAGGNVQLLDFDRYLPSSRVPGGTLLNNTYLVNTDLDKLNTEHVYALITLPNKVVPVKDARFRDGTNQVAGGARLKHLMTMDVVRRPEFDTSPGNVDKMPKGNLRPDELGALAGPDLKIQAWFAMKKVQEKLSFGLPQQINLAAPSPVYPDLVALPLLSRDRCYGPWVSSQLDGQAYLVKNIGGKTDFIKDESLSPWAYGGFYLMNEAGRLQAEFSNSLLLFSERGAFTVPVLPQGNSLCRSLLAGGPLVTSINVDVSTGGIRTTYQMDLYTASFGKLQKQKQEEISKISRERKKLNSERNALVRKGLGKNQSARNINQEYTDLASGRGLNAAPLALNTLAITASSRSRNTYSPQIGGGGFGSAGENFGSSSSNNLNITEYSSEASIQSDSTLAQTAQAYADPKDLAHAYYQTGTATMGEMFAAFSHGYHPTMSYRPNMSVNAHQSLLYIDEEKLTLEGSGSMPYGGSMR